MLFLFLSIIMSIKEIDEIVFGSIQDFRRIAWGIRIGTN